MVGIERLRMTLREKADLENAVAKTAQNEANIEYIAMMTDVELDFEEDAAEEVEE